MRGDLMGETLWGRPRGETSWEDLVEDLGYLYIIIRHDSLRELCLVVCGISTILYAQFSNRGVIRAVIAYYLHIKRPKRNNFYFFSLYL